MCHLRTIKFRTTREAEPGSASPKPGRVAASTAPRKAKPLANEPSTPPLPSPLGKKSRSRPTVTISTRAPLPMWSCPMGPTSITRSSKTARAGGIGSMRQGIQCWKGYRRKPERPRMACGLIRSWCRRGRVATFEMIPLASLNEPSVTTLPASPAMPCGLILPLLHWASLRGCHELD